MSRTYRNLEGMHRGALRFPQTYNEIRNLSAVMLDDDFEEYDLSKRNRISSRFHSVPTAWDDQVVSGYYQMDYKPHDV